MRLFALVYLLLFGNALWAASPPLKLVMLNVGEGQAILLQHEETALLIDSGHAGKASHVLRRLRHHGVDRLSALVLTHLHPDHASGYFRLREAFPDMLVYDNGHPLPVNVEPDMVRWVHQALEADPKRKPLHYPDSLRVGGLTLKVLWPQEPTGGNLNHHSMVLQLAFGQQQILVMGDADLATEDALLHQQRIGSNYSVLVAGHHGARDASGEAFLRRLRPDYALVSVNENNIRGYPHTESLARLKKHSRQLLRTDRDGEICLWLYEDGQHQHCN